MALMAEYGFSEGSGTTTADSSGNGHTLTGAGWSATGKTGTAAGGTGTSWVASTSGVGAGTAVTTYSVCGWLNVHAAPAASTFVGLFTESAAHWLEYSTVSAAVKVDWATTTGTVTSTATVALDIPTFVAVTVNGTANTLYQGTTTGNLAAAGTNAFGTAANLTATTWTVGSGNGDASFGAGDWLDELRVFNTTLTLAELQTWMATSVGAVAASTRFRRVGKRRW